MQNLLSSEAHQAIPGANPRAVPPEGKVQLNQFSLQVWPVVFWESGDLRRKTDLVLADCLTQLINTHFAQIRLSCAQVRRNLREKINLLGREVLRRPVL